MGKKRWTSKDIEDQTGRVAIVTGANSGIGYETAKALAAKGATVIVASRNEQRGRDAVERMLADLPDATVELIQLDLASLDSVRTFVKAFSSKHDRLDLLINNAGVMMPSKREETADGFELQFGTNHLGHFALTLQLIDKLSSTEGSRVVNVSSSAQNLGKLDFDDLQWSGRSYRRMPSYAQSKIANMLFTLELQRRLDAAGVSTIAAAAHPGWTATNLQQSSPVFRFFSPFMGMQPWQGALPTLYAAVAADAEPGCYYGPDGLGTMRGYPARNKPAPASLDADSARRLWEISEELVDVRMPDLSHAAPTDSNAVPLFVR
jgi:NAD(P)-dependent dehydrogenase (short-subunit alcohol dehydrogenase family)